MDDQLLLHRPSLADCASVRASAVQQLEESLFACHLLLYQRMAARLQSNQLQLDTASCETALVDKPVQSQQPASKPAGLSLADQASAAAAHMLECNSQDFGQPKQTALPEKAPVHGPCVTAASASQREVLCFPP